MPTAPRKVSTTKEAAPTKVAARKPLIQAVPDVTKFARPDESITVRNTLSTISVFVLRIDGADEISEFQAAGDRNGEDLMELPSTYLKNAQFRKQLARGIYEIVDADDPAVLEAVQAQKDAWEAKLSSQHENDALIAKQEVRAFSGVACIAQEGRLQCGEFAIRANANERPPLCSKHSYLASNYTPEETGQFKDGKPEVRWNLIQLTR